MPACLPAHASCVLEIDCYKKIASGGLLTSGRLVFIQYLMIDRLGALD
jgi:hypothetical protein